MSENCKEQRPLLFDDLSEEEHFEVHPRQTNPLYRGRAKVAATGAVSIITRWPEYWSSVLCYWWLGLSMFAITVFIIYNSVAAFALLPPSYMKSPRPRVNKAQLAYEASVPDLYMHLFIDSNDKVDLQNYVPYINIMSKKHSNFKYNLIVVLNDTSNEQIEMSAEQNNELALNSLWSKERIHERNVNGINVQHVTLSKYMDRSPLKKDWRFLPNHFIEFLVRAVSIWEKGGIAINPKILTPKTPNTLYYEKLQKILQNYGKPIKTDSKSNKDAINRLIHKYEKKSKKKVNNIQDIIDNVETFNTLLSSQESLAEAESKHEITKFRGRKLLSTLIKQEYSQEIKPPSIMPTNDNTHLHSREDRIDRKDTVDQNAYNFFKSDIDNTYLDMEGKSYLNRFLDFLFNDKSQIHQFPTTTTTGTSDMAKLTRERKSIEPQNKLTKSTISFTKKPEEGLVADLKPMIIVAKSIPVDDNTTKQATKNETIYGKDQLTLDLKGNILATESPCHAFLGTVFSNAIHYTDEQTLKDFIIAELSYFCKGLLSSCRGLDVILI